MNAFAYELLREELLPDLIGNDLDGILYWSGRNLARKYPLETIEEVIQFFEKAGWGTLSIVEHKRREMQFQLKAHSSQNVKNKTTFFLSTRSRIHR